MVPYQEQSRGKTKKLQIESGSLQKFEGPMASQKSEEMSYH